MICGQCNELKLLERNGNCATCNRALRRAENMKAPEPNEPIAKVSEKMGKQLGRYAGQKAKWIRGKKCVVFPHLPAVDVHHSMGRVGYADEWARLNEVPLLLDERYWLPVSREGHIKIEENPKWACENGYTFLRVTDPVFRVSNPLK